MSNPWKQNIFKLCQNAIRFMLWVCITLNVFIVSVFSIAFTYRFTVQLWGWLTRTIFDAPW